MLTLWDLLPKPMRRAWERSAASRPSVASGGRRPAAAAARRRSVSAPTPGAKQRGKQEFYDALTRRMLAEHGVRVRKWRTSMSGVAWTVTYGDGRVVRLIEAPQPRGPMSAAVFLHEIGHHAIGFDVYKPRCLEEHHAWAWALAAMEAHGVTITDGVKRRVTLSMRYAARKALRRRIKRLPPEVAAYLPTMERVFMTPL